MNTITPKLLKQFRNDYKKDYIHSLLENSITESTLESLFLERDIVQRYNYIFSKKIETGQNITNQKSSGRCWLFSFTNILRNDLIKEYKLPENFTLSNTYLFFYDKLEKCNYFIDNVIRNLDKEFDSKLIQFLIKDPITDGGNWHMAINLIKKYGIVPESNMHESRQSTNTSYLNYFLKDNLMIYMKQLRQEYYEMGRMLTATHIANLKSNMLSHIYKILCYFLGKPVNNFNWSYYTKEKKYKIINDLTPLKFYNNVMNFDPQEYVVCVNYPLKQYPYNKIYNIKYCNNMIDGNNTEMVNLPIDKLIKFTVKSINNNQGVWFGSDVGKYLDNNTGILDTDIFNFENLYDSDMLTKGESLIYKQSEPSHAMVIIGYDKNKDGEIDKWLVENSWGDKIGDVDNKGYLRMSTNWFKKYVYSIVVKKSCLDIKTLLAFYNKKNYIEVEPWGYMGCAALK